MLRAHGVLRLRVRRLTDRENDCRFGNPRHALIGFTPTPTTQAPCTPALAHNSPLDTDLTRNTRAPHFTPQHWLLAVWGCISSSSRFGKLPAGFNGVCTFIARSCAVSYVGRYGDKSPKKALKAFRSRTRRVWGHAAIFAWSDLILDRSRKLVGLQSFAACAARAGGDYGTQRLLACRSPQFFICFLFILPRSS